MRKLIVTTLILVLSLASFAQDGFKIIKDIPVTSVKNQAQSGTCWSFATISFLEAELLRLGKGEYDLSEMYMVRHAYMTKALYYMLRQGKTNFSSGGQSHDVINEILRYGIVPESVYEGLNYGSKVHNHGKLDKELREIVENARKEKLSATEAIAQVKEVLDTYLGEEPETFEYNGSEYTPETFRKHLGIDFNNYVEITSYLHLPFYQKVNLQIPDNWSGDAYYNVPLNELMEVINHALDYGYTVCWDGDVSGNFDRKNGTAEEDDESIEISPELREEKFLDFTTTDDHLMHITGLAKNKDGKIYYITKNSWGKATKYKGFWYMSENYIKMNTVAIMIHKDAIPEEIAKKLGIK